MLVTTELSAVELEEAAQRIKSLRRAATEHAVEIGRELLRIKESLPRGAFVKWVEKACEFKIRTAQDLMKLAREADTNTKLVALMVPSTLRVYLSKTTPPAVRTSILKRLESGEYVSRNELYSEALSAKAKSPPKTGSEMADDELFAGPDLLRAGGSPADLKTDRSRMVAEFLIRRLGRKDYELIMEGMNWEIWNRILVWMWAARVVDGERLELVQPGARAVQTLVGTTAKLQ
jgi:Protein of unknown function (DUF3102)